MEPCTEFFLAKSHNTAELLMIRQIVSSHFSGGRFCPILFSESREGASYTKFWEHAVQLSALLGFRYGYIVHHITSEATVAESRAKL